DRGRKDHWAMYQCPERIPVVFEPMAVVAGQDVAQAVIDKAEIDKEVAKRQMLETIVVRQGPRTRQIGNVPTAHEPAALTADQLSARTHLIGPLKYSVASEVRQLIADVYSSKFNGPALWNENGGLELHHLLTNPYAIIAHERTNSIVVYCYKPLF